MKGNPYQAYKQQSVLTMTPGDLLLALYDRIAKELTIAVISLEKNDITEINRSLQKAQLILKHLNDTLDHQYEVSASLSALYEYFIWVTVQANLKKDSKGLEEIIVMVQELRESFAKADKETRIAKETVKTEKINLEG